MTAGGPDPAADLRWLVEEMLADLDRQCTPGTLGTFSHFSPEFGYSFLSPFEPSDTTFSDGVDAVSKPRRSFLFALLLLAFLLVGVFARGLLKAAVTRLYLDGEGAEDETLVARLEDGAYRIDLRLQGDDATAFFEL